MANDPEARASGSSAIIVAIVALVLVVGIAFMLMNRGGEAPDTTVVNNPVPSTTVVEKETTREVPVPVPGHTTVVVPPAPKADAPAAPAGDEKTK